MKINKFMLVGIFLLAILTIGAVSASENITDVDGSSKDSNILMDDEDEYDGFEEYDDGSGTENANMKVSWPSTVKVGDYPSINFTLPDDVDDDSKVILFINNERVDDGINARYHNIYEFFIDEFGTYDIKIKFCGDDKYAPYSENHKYVVKDYLFDVENPSKYGSLIYGEATEILIQLPYDAEGSVSVNGEKYLIDEETSFYVPLKNLKLGTNTIQVKYSGDEKYKSKTVQFNVEVISNVVYSSYMPFNNVTFSLKLPDGAKGVLLITVDGNLNKTSKFVNGIAEIKFDDLTLGGHRFHAKYVGNDYNFDLGEEKHFEVIPQITVDSFKTLDDENTVEIVIPDGEMGRLDVILYRYLEKDDGIIISEVSKSINVSGEDSISFSKLYEGYYSYSIKYTSDKGFFYNNVYEGYVRNNFDMNVSCPDVVLADDGNITIHVDFLKVDWGTLSLYVDNVLYDEDSIYDTDFIEFYIDDGLSVGNHAISLKFNGNDKYVPLSKEFTLTSTYLMFNIPDEIIIGENDLISINAVADATGQLAVYVDGVEFGRETIKKGWASINMSSLPFKSYSIRVSYEKGNYKAISKSLTLNVSYSFGMSNETFEYAGSNLYTFNLPEGLSTNGFVVKIDNVNYPWVADGNGVYVDVSNLSIGPHIISATHPGNSYYYPISIQKTINVAGKINVPSNVTFGSSKAIYLILPQNPQGRLTIYEYDDIFDYYDEIGSVGFVSYGEGRSIAEYSLVGFDLGEHDIKAVYTGDDYSVSDVNGIISVGLDIKYNHAIQYGKTSTMTVYLEDADGSIDVYLDGEYVDMADFVDGVATIKFEDLEIGQHNFELEYIGYSSFYFEGMFGVYPAISVPSVVIDGSKSISIGAGDEPVGTIIVNVDGKKFKEIDLEDEKETISLSSLATGTHKISIFYDSWDEFSYENNYVVTVKKSTISAKDLSMFYLDGSKFKVQIKDYKGKSVGKGKSVKFYVDGKLFKTVKTDSKGYASVVLNHVPKTHSVKVVYKATTVTKKVTIKQILTLSKVTVKRSAKSLVLSATLKKVKGKYLNNVPITFKFKDNTYRVFTNSKGVAKATIDAKILKKLKAGKSVTYQATYAGTTVKQTVKVKN